MSRDNDSYNEALVEQACEDAYRVVQLPNRTYSQKMRDLIRVNEQQKQEK